MMLTDEIEDKNRTHWLSSPPAVIELLSAPQGEGGIKHRVIHGVTYNPMRLWIETLRNKITLRLCLVLEL